MARARRSDLAEAISDADELRQVQCDHLSQIHISLRWSTIEPRTRPHVHSNGYAWMRFCRDPRRCDLRMTARRSDTIPEHNGARNGRTRDLDIIVDTKLRPPFLLSLKSVQQPS